MIAERIETGANNMGIELPAGAAAKMQDYWEKVLETNSSLNLTRIVEEEAACGLHFLDSLAPLQYGYDMIPKNARTLDVGTGAGFPGVPIAIARPDVRMTLIDARRKRIGFIEQALADIEPKIEARHSRAEEIKDRYDVVFARAVTSGAALVRLLLPLISPGGTAIFWKGPGVFNELSEIDRESSRFGACLLDPIFYEISGIDAKRCLVLIEKSR